MRVLFAAGDVGGARAIMPIIDLARRQNLQTAVLCNGHLASEGPKDWSWVSLTGTDPGAADALIDTAGPQVMIFATSVKDTAALTLARAAARRGISTIHVLDSWTMYRQRLANDGGPMLVPSIYAVIDEIAAQGAVADGIPRAIVRITGQPALDNAGWRATADSAAQSSDGRVQLLFVSEPAAADHGSSAQAPFYRGYTEATVLALLCAALQPLADHVALKLLPHPRENPKDLEANWRAHKGALTGDVLPQHGLGNGLARFDAVVGMGSILLYQAWVLGKPVLSLQPGLRIESLRQIGQREGAVLVDQSADAVERVQTWAAAVKPGQPVIPRPELALHARSAECILSLARDLAGHPAATRK